MSEPGQLHLIGVGGSGMLPLALLLKQAGHPVTGRDAFCPPERLALLEAHGITVHSEADPARVKDADCVVVSPAIPETDVERRAARRDGVTVKTRFKMLAELIAERLNVCVAGSHGKSTTTAMLVHILSSAGQDDFGYMLGASFAAPDSAPARLGAPHALFVTEACEAYGALAHWQPAHAILTNLDDDHADHYGGQPGLTQAFASFLSRLPKDGVAVACGDDPRVVEILREARCSALTYGFGDQNRLRAVLDTDGRATVFLDGRELGPLVLRVPGNHNLLNGLAALGIALTLGVGFPTAAGALAEFDGIQRRLQRIPTENGLTIFDDFAHHPTAIKTTLAGLRAKVGDGKIIAIIEPRSNTMKQGVHQQTLLPSAETADRILWANLNNMDWLPELIAGWQALNAESDRHRVAATVEDLLARTLEDLPSPCHIVIMSNGGFGGIHGKLIAELERIRG